jgi:hypothetical protein
MVGITLIASVLLTVPACMPTYPREKLAEAVKSVCKIEYDMDVDVTVTGSTMGMYYPMQGLLDIGFGISEDAWDQISNLILVASRVVLSTDADIKFYCVVTQDARLPELQVVIIKYVEDVKRSMYRNISRSESYRRTLFSINLTPQARKERSVEKVFDKLGIEDTTRQKVLDEFFRSPPTKLSDIGYWKGNFYLKDITLEEFLAAQIANRVKIEFHGDKKLKQLFSYKSAEGFFVQAPDGGHFLLKFKIEDQSTDEAEGESLHLTKIRQIIHIANQVIYGYKFKDFAFMEMEDQLENAKLSVGAQEIYDFNKDKLSVEAIVQAPGGYF